MIRWLMAALTALLIGTVIAMAVVTENGYVLIGYDVWTIEGSLALFLLLDVIAFGLLYFAIRFLIRLWQSPQRVRQWHHQRQIRLAQKALTRGLLEMAEGDWKKAEKRLVRFAPSAETPLLNYLAAARAAQLQGAHERRDEYLHLAHESMPSADVAVSLTQAELQLAHQQMEQALATLKHLQNIAPKHVYVLKLLSELYQQLGDWEQLRELLPELKRRKVANTEVLLKLETRVYQYSLQQASAIDLEALTSAWKSVPRKLRKSEQILRDYVRHLISLNSMESALKAIDQHLSQASPDTHEWNDEFVLMYEKIECLDPAKQLTGAEKWLQKNPENAVLLHVLGRLSLRAKLWGKARSYLEASIKIAPSADTYQELANLLEELGEEDKAIECYRQGLKTGASEAPVRLPKGIHIGQQTSAQVESLPLATDRTPPADIAIPEQFAK